MFKTNIIPETRFLNAQSIGFVIWMRKNRIFHKNFLYIWIEF